MLTINIEKKAKSYFLKTSSYDKSFVDNLKSLENDKREWLKDEKLWKVADLFLYELIILHKGSKDVFFQFASDKEKADFVKKFDSFKKQIQKRNEFKENQRLISLKRTEVNKNIPKFYEDAKKIDFSKFLKEGVVPFEHQSASVKYLDFVNSGILAMDPGTGKTLASLMYCEYKNFKKVLIIIPKSLFYTWCMEGIERFINSKYYIINSKNNKYDIKESKYFIINYDYFNDAKFDYKKKVEDIGIGKIDALICDEAHKLKSSKSNTYKNISKHFKEIKYKVLLSGTIMPNKPEELYTLFKLTAPYEITDKQTFQIDMCKMVKHPYGYGYVLPKNVNYNDIYNSIKNYFFRIKKSDVLDLPEASFIDIPVVLSPKEQEEYDTISDGFTEIDWDTFNINDKEQTELVLTILMKLRQYLSHIKAERVIEHLIELNEINEKALVFDCFKGSLKRIKEQLPDNSELYTGEIESNKRGEIIEYFKQNNQHLQNLLMTIGAGSVGLNLTNASYLFQLTLDYVPSNNEQAYARIHRHGQTKSVTIYNLHANGTIDDDVRSVVMKKMNVINRLIDNEGSDNINEEQKISTTKEIMMRIKSKYKK